VLQLKLIVYDFLAKLIQVLVYVLHHVVHNLVEEISRYVVI
jgi:hypothetical protein